MSFKVLYRGPLSSCNFDCGYCPFAKNVSSRTELAADVEALERFVGWCRQRDHEPLGVLFTPWGEGLVRSWYRDALVELSQMPHVEVAAIQTNLSAPLSFVEEADPASLGIWATWHPEWMPRGRFVERVALLHERGVRVSAGMVGLPRFFEEIESLRRELPPDVYLWVNAAKSSVTYTEAQIERLSRIDPLFRINTRHHASLGRSCRAGHTVISVDGDGNARRCHFIDEPIGNIYEPGFDRALKPRLCTNATCGCHIGYVHLEYLELDKVFASGILERRPVSRELRAGSLPIAPGRR